MMLEEKTAYAGDINVLKLEVKNLETQIKMLQVNHRDMHVEWDRAYCKV